MGQRFWGDNDDARVVRIDYVRGTRAPVPALKLRLSTVLRRWKCISRDAIPLIPIRGRC